MKLTRGRKAAILVGLVIFVVGVSSSASWAVWSITGSATTTVAAGTIGISANGSATAALTGLNTAQDGPGTTATVPVTIQNTSSTLPMTYTTVLNSVETPSNSVIGDNTTYVVWVTTATSKCVAGATVGTPSWTGNLATGTTTLGANRALAAGASEILCVRTTLSSNAPTSIQGQSLALTMTFTGSST